MEINRTITTIFMVPTLKIDRNKIRWNGFVNGFIKDEDAPLAYENAIFLLFKPEDFTKFRAFLEEEYKRTVSLIDDYDYEGGYVVLVYELNPKFRRDFKLIQEGLYSKTSREFQSIFPKMIRVTKETWSQDEMSLQHRIFNKTDDLRKYWEDKLGVEFDESMEVWEGFFPENEILNIGKIREVYA